MVLFWALLVMRHNGEGESNLQFCVFFWFETIAFTWSGFSGFWSNLWVSKTFKIYYQANFNVCWAILDGFTKEKKWDFEFRVLDKYFFAFAIWAKWTTKHFQGFTGCLLLHIERPHLSNSICLKKIAMLKCFRDFQENIIGWLGGFSSLGLSGNKASSSKDMWLHKWPANHSIKNTA